MVNLVHKQRPSLHSEKATCAEEDMGTFTSSNLNFTHIDNSSFRMSRIILLLIKHFKHLLQENYNRIATLVPAL